MIKTFLFSLLLSIPSLAHPNQTKHIVNHLVAVTVIQPTVHKHKKKFRWKQIFRPFKIFKKKISFWWLLFFGITLFLGGSFFLLDKSSIAFEGGFAKAIFYLFAGLFSLSAILTVIILIALPILLIIRIIKELKWGKRYERCV